jgi:NADPH:quinone reductase-like Zn-dependent oxidoreductase
VQLARWRVARVLARASARDTAFVSSVGGNDVIDYHAMRLEEKLRGTDVVLDTIGGETHERCWRVLRKGGVLITLVSPIPTGPAEQHSVHAYFSLSVEIENRSIKISALADAGKLKLRPVIAEVLLLARASEAFEHGAQATLQGRLRSM